MQDFVLYYYLIVHNLRPFLPIQYEDDFCLPFLTDVKPIYLFDTK